MFKNVCSLLLIFLVTKWMNNVNTTLFFNREIQDKYKNSLTVDAKVKLLPVLRILVFIRRFIQWLSISFAESSYFQSSLRIFDVILHYFGRCSLIAFIYSIQGTNREGTISRGPDTGPLCKNPVRYAEKIALLLDPKVPCSRGEKQ